MQEITLDPDAPKHQAKDTSSEDHQKLAEHLNRTVQTSDPEESIEAQMRSDAAKQSLGENIGKFLADLQFKSGEIDVLRYRLDKANRRNEELDRQLKALEQELIALTQKESA